MPTIELIQLYNRLAAKPEPKGSGQRALRERLLARCQQELEQRAHSAGAAYGLKLHHENHN